MTAARGIVHDVPALRGVAPAFADRRHAGRVLAEIVDPGDDDAVVLAIAPGGVPVGVEIALRHSLPARPAIVAVLEPPWRSRPGHGALAFGAVAFDGTLLFDHDVIASLAVNRKQIELAVARALEHVETRTRAYPRGALADLDLTGRTAIVVDDGLVPDVAVRAVVAAARNWGARRVVLARPAAPGHELRRLARDADRTYCASIHGGCRFTPADAFESPDPLTDREARALLPDIEPPSRVRPRARLLQATRA